MRRVVRLMAVPFLQPRFSRLDALLLMSVVWFVSTSSSAWASAIAFAIGMTGSGMVTTPTSWLLRRASKDDPC